MKRDGATPIYGQLWVGTWTKSYWSGFESDLRKLRDEGVTPVIMWYYWGDGISPNAVTYGKDGRSKTEWNSMAGELARRAAAVMGSKEFIVVLEPEFNKNGIQNWETFDGYLANQAWKIRGAAPSAKIVVGFGHWGGWDIFDRAVGASHMSGFQLLRGSTRDTSYKGETVADDMLRITKALKAKFGKGVFMYDLGIATYGGWEGVQERGLQRVIAKAGELEAAGMKGLVWRYVYDNNHSSGYYGSAESSWGVKFSWGGKKRAYDELVTLISTEKPSTSISSTTTSLSGSTSSSATTFTSVTGNEWWIQANVAGSPHWVAASVDGGAWKTMSKKSWGAYAVSTQAKTGSVVELIAKYGDGSTKTAKYNWPSATPASGSGSASSFDAQFSSVKGNEWWVQATVKSSDSISKVEVRVDGGSWKTMEKKSWGAWAVSTRAPAGSNVELRATSSSGATDTQSFKWLA